MAQASAPVNLTDSDTDVIKKAQAEIKNGTSIITIAMKEALKALGYSTLEIKKFTVDGAKKAINDMTTKQSEIDTANERDRKLNEADKKAAKDAQKEINAEIMSIQSYDDYLRVKDIVYGLIGQYDSLFEKHGIDSKLFDKSLKDAKGLLTDSVNFEDVQVDDVLIRKKGNRIQVVEKTADGVSYKVYGGSDKIQFMAKEKLEKDIKYRWSEAFKNMDAPQEAEITEQDKELAKESTKVALDTDGLDAMKQADEKADTMSEEEADEDLINNAC